MATILPHTTRASGTVLTAAIYNGDHQVHITNANSLNNELNGIADVAIVTGLVVSNGANSITGVSIAGTSNEISVANNDGLTGNPTISLPSAITLTGKTITGGTFTSMSMDEAATIVSDDTGAGAGPTFTLHRDSASPLLNDIIGQINFDGEDSGSVQTTYAKMFATIIDPTNATEDGIFTIQVMVAGALTNRIIANDTGVSITGAVSISSTLTTLGALTVAGNSTINGTLTVTG